MKKPITFIFTILFLTSCYPIKEVISENYEVDNELNFKILKYSEPTTNASFIRSEDAKYVNLTITMTNKSSKPREVNFGDFFIANDQNDMKSPLWKVNRGVEMAGTENTTVKFEALETKKLWLSFLAPKNAQIKFLIFNGKQIELKFGKTKQAMF
ncbi:hypothetical protein [Algibacter sp. Ld11]|uniref:hypothetical protein n=1 Tax=Algibacter sp. Ld11 TaxID=649150 RepID=UPI00386FCDB3